MFLAPSSEEPYISESLSVSLSVSTTEFLNSYLRAQYLSTWSSDSAEIWHTY